MTRIYAATMLAIFVTTSLATNVLVVGTRGPFATLLSTRLRSVSRRLRRRVKGVIDARVAAMLSRREEQASAWAFHHVSDRELKDVGFYRTRVSRGDLYAGAHLSPADARTVFSVAYALEEEVQ